MGLGVLREVSLKQAREYRTAIVFYFGRSILPDTSKCEVISII
ncbi:hypothetical protein [Bartonella grahamii]